MKVLVGSANPVKIAAATEAFGRYFDGVAAEGVSVPTGVGSQPIGDATIAGARNRAQALRAAHDADYYVGIEGGVAQHDGRWMSFTAVTIIDRHGEEGSGLSPHFALPSSIAERLIAGEELGDVIDEQLGDTNTKQKEGAIGHFSKGVCTRKDLCTAGVLMALIPFLNRERYFPS